MLSISQYIAKVGNRQQSFAKSYKHIQLRDPRPHDEVIKDRHRFFKEKLTRTDRDVFNYLLVWSNTHRSLYFRQDTIASSVGCSRKSVNVAIRKLTDYGIIASLYRSTRNKFTSSIYTISSWFRNMEVRESLRHIFNAFVCFPVALLLMSSKPVIAENVTRYSKSIYISNQSRICKSRDTSARAREIEHHPWLERFAIPTRVEKMASWSPVDDIYPPNDPFRPAIPQSKLFEDPRIKIHSKDEDSQAFQKRGNATRGSKQSGQSLRSSMATQELIRRNKETEDRNIASWQKDPDELEQMWAEAHDRLKNAPEMVHWLVALGKKCHSRYIKTQPDYVDPLLELSKLTPEQVATRMLGKTRQQQEQIFQDVLRARRKYCNP